jgi:Domain of unknown function (DUF4436)
LLLIAIVVDVVLLRETPLPESFCPTGSRLSCRLALSWRRAGSRSGLLGRTYIDASFLKDADKNDIDIKIGVTRSTIVKTVVIFSMILLWILTATVVAMVVAVLIGNKIEMVMFPFIGTILFSMVAFRNALPGAPPIGALSDYMAFFWGYAICVLALMALMITWLRRLPRQRSAEDGGEEAPRK